MENRTPQRDKAVRTRQRLLEATLAQTAACGYHNITVDKIAAAAGVSTGSAYRYFRNKKEMLHAALAYYYENIQEFSGTPDSSLRSFSSPEDMLAYVLGQFYGLHRKYYALHEELESLRHIDPDVRDAYHRILLDAVDTLVQKCPPAYAGLPALRERIYLGIQLLESFAHTQLETSLCSQFDMESMQTLCLRIAVELLTPPHQTGSDTAVSCSH